MTPKSPQDDVGTQAVQFHYEKARVDPEWSEWTDRGFTWWGHQLAQTVWSEPAREEWGDQVWQLRAECAVLKNVRGTPAMLECLVNYNARMNFLGPLVYDPTRRKILLRSSFPVTTETAGFARMVFSLAVAIQADAADRLARDSEFSTRLGGELDVSSRREKGLRAEPDEMLNVIRSLVVPRGLAVPDNILAELKAIEELEGPSVLTNSDGYNLTAEFEYAGHTGLFPEIFGPRGKPLTSLYQIATEEAHPLLCGGCYCRLFIPADPPADRTCELLNHYNLREQTDPKYLYGIGVWKLVAEQSVEHLCYEIFLPTMLLQRGLLTNVFMNAYLHSEWMKNDMGLLPAAARKK